MFIKTNARLRVTNHHRTSSYLAFSPAGSIPGIAHHWLSRAQSWLLHYLGCLSKKYESMRAIILQLSRFFQKIHHIFCNGSTSSQKIEIEYCNLSVTLINYRDILLEGIQYAMSSETAELLSKFAQGSVTARDRLHQWV